MLTGIFTMIPLLLLLAAGLAVGASQPVTCTEDSQCHEGYCDREGHYCVKCLHCEEYNRNPPATTISCITTVSDCGTCYEGFVESGDGDLYAKCSSGAQSSAWVTVVIPICVVVLLVAACVIVVYAIRHTDTFRIRTRTSMQTSFPSPFPGNGVAPSAPSAPEPPPPYKLYSHVPPAPSPTHDEAEAPFIKPPAPTPARESAGNQAANVYNNPAYVRGPPGPHLPNNYFAEEIEEETRSLHDDDETTVPSPWAPNAANNNTNEISDSASGSASGSSSESAGGSGAASSLPALLNAARTTTLVRPPSTDGASTTKRARQDTNNNRSNRDRDDDETMFRPGGGVIVNVHVVQQINDVKL